jgi:MFS family permease
MDVAHQSMSQRANIAAAWLVASMIAAMFMGSTVITPLYVLYKQAFGFSAITLTLVYAAYVVGNLTAVLFFGRLSDQIGRKRTVLPAIGLAAISSLLFLFAHGTAWLFVGRMVSGLAVGLSAGAGTAWLVDLDEDKAHATLMATGGNFAGLAVGALLAGLLAEYAPWPLYLPIMIGRTWETARHQGLEFSKISLRPRFGVPQGIRSQFIAPAATAFGTFAFIGFYAALIPSLLAESLGQRNHAVAGAIVCLLFAVATASVVAGRDLKGCTAMFAGLALLLPSLALLILAQMLASMSLMLVGTTVGGVAAALGYRGSLEVVNQIAPADRRAGTVSSYLVVCFTGNSVPVTGVGALTVAVGSVMADTVFAIITGLIAIMALAVGYIYIPDQAGQR